MSALRGLAANAIAVALLPKVTTLTMYVRDLVAVLEEVVELSVEREEVVARSDYVEREVQRNEQYCEDRASGRHALVVWK